MGQPITINIKMYVIVLEEFWENIYLRESDDWIKIAALLYVHEERIQHAYAYKIGRVNIATYT